MKKYNTNEVIKATYLGKLDLQGEIVAVWDDTGEREYYVKTEPLFFNGAFREYFVLTESEITGVL